MQSKDQQVSALLHLMEQACQDESVLQEFKQKLQALPYPLDEIAESAAKLFRKCDQENSAGSESVAILVREEALSRETALLWRRLPTPCACMLSIQPQKSVFNGSKRRSLNSS